VVLGDTIEVDKVAYREYFGLLEENAEIADSLVGSQEIRDSLMSVLRSGYTMGSGYEGVF
jgi:hypothetical protein